MEQNGMLHLYIGNGKGKTTSAVGLAVRALGWGKKVLFAQFLKSAPTGEKCFFESFMHHVLFFRPKQRHNDFLWNMTQEQLIDTKEDICEGWMNLKHEILSGKWDIVVLDEILDVIHCDLVNESEVLNVIINRPAKVEIVCTGREASNGIREKADYISYVQAQKHPYDRGIPGRQGIEY